MRVHSSTMFKVHSVSLCGNLCVSLCGNEVELCVPLATRECMYNLIVFVDDERSPLLIFTDSCACVT